MLWRMVVAWREGYALPLLAMLSCSWSLSHLCICWSIRHSCILGGDGRQGISPKPPKIQTANGTAICWGYDVIECEDWHDTITWRRANLVSFSSFFTADIALIRCRSWKRQLKVSSIFILSIKRRLHVWTGNSWRVFFAFQNSFCQSNIFSELVLRAYILIFPVLFPIP